MQFKNDCISQQSIATSASLNWMQSLNFFLLSFDEWKSIQHQLSLRAATGKHWSETITTENAAFATKENSDAHNLLIDDGWMSFQNSEFLTTQAETFA